MNIKELILDQIRKKEKIKVADIVKATGFSRAYVNRFFREFRDEGKIVLIGRTNRSVYIMADKKVLRESKKDILDIQKKLKNKNLSEDIVLDSIKRETGIFIGLKDNIKKNVDYAFTEILNNAIEHSRSKQIFIKMEKGKDQIRFEVVDKGVGIFNNIMAKKNLAGPLEAIQELLKGKQTTDPKKHSGEGIFFTSKVADSLVIEGSNKKLLFNNFVEDFFISDIKKRVGTRIIFTIGLRSPRNLGKVFEEYSEESFEFSKTIINVKLYKLSYSHISRSQARRIFSGLDKFKTIVLDFDKVRTVGQGFADEIFRVWQNKYPGIKIKTKIRIKILNL